MRKILSFFLQLIITLQFFVLSSQNVSAANCTLTTIPNPVTTNDNSVTLRITTSGLVDNKDYYVWLNARIISETAPSSAYSTIGTPAKFQPINGVITVNNLGPYGGINTRPDSTIKFTSGEEKIKVTNTENSTTFCELSFSVQGSTSGGTCQISFLNTSFTENDNIRIKSTDNGNPNEERRIILKRRTEHGPEVNLPNEQPLISGIPATVAQLTNTGIDLGRHERDYYYIEIRDSYKNPFSQRMCFTAFGIPQGPLATPNPLFSPACKDNNCNTALGPISTDPAKFVTNIFGILLSLAGGVALILVMVSGYRLMASQGNPEKVQAAREQLTSAIVGLLFIIFSLSILQIIGVDILNIPGFAP